MIVPQEIRNREFDRCFNGYDREEVTAFLHELAGEYEELYSHNERLKDGLHQFRTQIEIFKETEGKLDQVLDLTREKARDVEERSVAEAELLLENAHRRISQTLDAYREVVQRISAFSEEAGSVLRENEAFYAEANLIQRDATDQAGREPVGEMELLRTRVDNLLKGLDDYEGIIGGYTAATDRGEITVEYLMSQLWGKTLPTTLIEDKVIVPTVFERTKLLIPAVKSTKVVQPQIPWEMPRVVSQKNNVKSRPGWVFILAAVVILGVIGGYCWRHDLIPWSPWGQESGVPAQTATGENRNSGGSSAPTVPAEGQESIPPLLEAVMNHDADKIDQLLASGSSPDVANQKGETSLMVAAYQGESEIAKSLLKAGADPNIKEKEWGVTPLMYASFQGNLETAKMLLEYDADPNISNREGWTALMCAAFAGRPKTAQMLLQAGADPNMKTSDGWTAYELALLAEREVTAKTLKAAGVTATEKTGSGQKFTANQDMLRLFDARDKR